MAAPTPLYTLLSQALVAFTIEFDNEAEHRLPHRTTRFGSVGRGLWLASMAMWSNCMKFVSTDGITMHELECRARARPNWNGMIRWGYIFLEPAPGDERPKPPMSALIVRPTVRGRLAQQVWEPLTAIIEQRWRERFGAAAIGALREELEAMAAQLDPGLPDCLPILKFGLFCEVPEHKKCPEAVGKLDVSQLPLPALLSRVLLAFALEFERASPVSLAIASNVLRLVEPEGIRLRDLPLRSGVSKESIAMALTFLKARRYIRVLSEQPPGKWKLLLLTPEGVLAQAQTKTLLDEIEPRWRERFGTSRLTRLAKTLQGIVGGGSAENSPLFQGLKPYHDGWRAKVAKPQVLPHFPMVLHRGGFPDGS